MRSAVPSTWTLLGHVAANRLYQQMAMLLVLILTARWLGPDGRGTLAAAIAWVQLGGTVTGLSLGRVAFRHGVTADRASPSRQLVATMAAAFGLAYGVLILAVLAGTALAGGQVLGGLPASIAALALLTIPVIVWEDYAFYLLTSQSLLARNLTIVSIGRTVGMLLLVLFVTFLQFGVVGAMAALLAGQAISGFWTFLIVNSRMSGLFHIDVRMLRDILGKCARLHPQTIAAALFGATDIVLLHALRSDAEAGLYQVAWALVAVPVFVSSAIGNVLYQLIAERGADGAWLQQVRLMSLALGLAAAGSAIVYFAAPVAVPAIFGSAFEPSAAILIGLLPFGFAQMLSNLMTPQWVSRGLFVAFSTFTITIALASVSLNLVLIPEQGVSGAVHTSWITATASLAANGGLAIWISFRRGSA